MKDKRKLPSHLGNKYGEKWSKKDAIRLFDNLLAWLKDDKNKENCILNEFLFEVEDQSQYKGKFYKDILSYLSHRFEECSDLHEQVLAICAGRLQKYGLTSKYNQKMATFILSCNYGMHEKTEQIVTNVNIPVLNIDPLADDILLSSDNND